MLARILCLCIMGVALAGCQSLQKSNWVRANQSAMQVYGDRNMEIWHVDKRCYYFLKRQLKYIYDCPGYGTVQQKKKPRARFHSALLEVPASATGTQDGIW